MHVELQISAAKFLMLARNLLKAQSLCFIDPYPVPAKWFNPSADLNDTVLAYIDHVDILNTTTLDFSSAFADYVIAYTGNHISVNPLQIHQPLNIRFITYDSLVYADDQPPDSYFTLEIVLELDLRMVEEKDGWRFAIQLADVVSFLGPIPAVIQQQIKLAISKIQQPSAINLKALEKVTGEPISAIQAGISADLKLQRVAIRLEVEAPGSREGNSAWIKFFHGGITNSLLLTWSVVIPGTVEYDSHGKPIKGAGTPSAAEVYSAAGDWSLFIDFDIFRPALVHAIDPGLQKRTTALQVDTNKGVDVTWAPSNFQANAIVKFSASVHTPLNDVGVDLTIWTALGIGPDKEQPGQSDIITSNTFDYKATFLNGFEATKQPSQRNILITSSSLNRIAKYRTIRPKMFTL